MDAGYPGMNPNVIVYEEPHAIFSGLFFKPRKPRPFSKRSSLRESPLSWWVATTYIMILCERSFFLGNIDVSLFRIRLINQELDIQTLAFFARLLVSSGRRAKSQDIRYDHR